MLARGPSYVKLGVLVQSAWFGCSMPTNIRLAHAHDDLGCIDVEQTVLSIDSLEIDLNLSLMGDSNLPLIHSIGLKTMFNIQYTHTSKSSFAAKRFTFTGEEGMTIEQKVPNQARQIIQYAFQLSQEADDFSLTELANYIDQHHEGTFTTSKGGTERIVRYYSKLLQETGILSA